MAKASKAPVKDTKDTSIPEVSPKSKSKSKATKSKPTPKLVDQVDVEASEVVHTSAKTTTPTVEAADVVLTEAFSEFMAKFQSLVSQMNSLKTEFRALEKKTIREMKAALKLSSKRKRKSGNRSPSGFVKPTLISNELATFLKKPLGSEMARTEVTREINGYIRANNLQDKQNGRKINPDKNLAVLLKINDGEELTYFNLQRYMSPHFAKANCALPKVDQIIEDSTA